MFKIGFSTERLILSVSIYSRYILGDEMQSSHSKLRHEKGRVELVNQIFYPEIIEQTFEEKNIRYFTIKGASLKVTILSFFS